MISPLKLILLAHNPRPMNRENPTGRKQGPAYIRGFGESECHVARTCMRQHDLTFKATFVRQTKYMLIKTDTARRKLLAFTSVVGSYEQSHHSLGHLRGGPVYSSHASGTQITFTWTIRCPHVTSDTPRFNLAGFARKRRIQVPPGNSPFIPCRSRHLHGAPLVVSAFR